MPQVDRTYLLYLLVFTVCLTLTSGYVLDNHSRRNNRIRGREGATTPAAPSAPVKTNEEQDVDGLGGNPRDSDRDRDVQRNEFVTDTSLEGETHHGQGSLSSWFNQLFPSSGGYHGHVQLGPGLSLNVSSGINLGGASSQPWWLGPHVCVTNERKEDGGDRSRTGSRIFHHSLMITHSCDENVSVRKCVTVKSSNGRTTTTTQTYECCRGFEREEDQRYCTEEQDRVDLISTMEHLSATEMVRALAMSGLTSVIQASNYTIFTPINQAFDRYYKPDPDMNVVVINEEMQRLASGLSAAMTSHIVPGFLLTSSMEDEQLIQTENPESKIRINKYMVMGREAQVITANCVPISRTNVKATNGIVHVVDSVLKPVSKDIKSIIRGDPRLRIMSNMLETITLEEGGHYTILAPTDQAFQKLKPVVRDRIMMGHKCGKDIIKQHILPNVICTTVIQERVRTRNVLNEYVHMSRDHDQILVESSPVLQRDVMATNGVVHVIDSVILPSSSAVDVMEAIEKSGATRFLELMRATNGEQQLNSLENYTLFVPSNEALEEAGHLNADRSHYNIEASKLLARHVISGVTRGRQLYHGRQLNSSNHRDVYTVQSYQGIPFSTRSVKSVQCSPIIQSDIDTCDAVIHVVSKLIVPPSGNVIDLLQKNSTFSELLQLIRSAQLIDLLSDNERPFTLFAPTNQAFNQLPNEFMNELRNDSSKARRVILGHIIPDMRCCIGISNNDLFTSYVLNMDGWMINMDRSPRTDRVRYGSAHVVSCDHTATNGVIHAIDTLSPLVVHRHSPRPPRRRGHSGYRFSLDNLWSMFD